MMIEKLMRRLPDAKDEELLEELLDEAASFICAYTRRSEVPEGLQEAQVRIACLLFNRMGMEGEKSHSEGGVSRTAEMLPEDLKRWLNGWRLAKTVCK